MALPRLSHRDAARSPRPSPPPTLACIGRGWLVAILAGCACYAGVVALVSGVSTHRLWGACAAGGYALAALLALAWKRRGTDAALLAGLAGALAAPLGVMAASGRAQHEVFVISRSAWLLIQHGSPYRTVAALATTHNPDAYNPYLPAMSLFGLGHALAGRGLLTDPRIWFTVVFAAVFPLALRVAGAADVSRWALLVIASPLVAFPLAVGGDDVPVLGLVCLGLAMLSTARGEPRPVVSGLVLGVAAALKATAWPAVLIAAVLLAARDGRRAAAAFGAAVLAVLAVTVGPVAAMFPGELADNTVLFPLGLASVRSGAASPLPGYLIAHTGHLGNLVAGGLLGLAGLAIAVWLVARPPRDVAAATWRLVIALVAFFTLAPSTRFGYYIYPLGLWAWLWISGLAGSGARSSPGGEPDTVV